MPTKLIRSNREMVTQIIIYKKHTTVQPTQKARLMLRLDGELLGARLGDDALHRDVRVRPVQPVGPVRQALHVLDAVAPVMHVARVAGDRER